MRAKDLIKLLGNHDEKYLNKQAEGEYHFYILNTLENFLDKGTPGLSEKLNSDLLKRYNTSNWQEAYSEASNFHHKYSVTDSSFELDKTYEKDLKEWIKDALVIGDRPKYSFFEYLSRKYYLPDNFLPLNKKIDLD